MNRIAIMLVVAAACVDESTPTPPIESLRDACGEPPLAEPGFSIVPGTYPGQTDRVCLYTQQYVDRDAWTQDVAAYASCAAFYACRQLDDCGEHGL